MRTYPRVGLAVGEVLLPRKDVDPGRWAVVACDQYSSEPDYWADVDRLVGQAPSTLRLTYPEAFLNEAEPERRIAAIQTTMRTYLGSGVVEPHEGMIFVERTIGGHCRRGLMVCLDLERYDFARGSTSLVRATEGTIVERIPPRLRIRRGAPLELPHILVLLDDPEDSVLGPIAARKASLPALYDFELMKGGGHLSGRLVDDRALEAGVVAALEGLAEPAAFARRYGLPAGTPPLLFAVGDGNHSLATAKAAWEEMKGAGAPMDSLARFALVELGNVHDPSLVFEPIHRVLFKIAPGRDVVAELERHYPGQVRIAPAASLEVMRGQVLEAPAGLQRIGVIAEPGYRVVEVKGAPANLAVGTLQAFLDPFVKGGGAHEIDYVHGTETVDLLGRKAGNVGFFLPPMAKLDLFKTVLLDGALPRKTFSMGEAHEKRFYMECRRIG